MSRRRTQVKGVLHAHRAPGRQFVKAEPDIARHIEVREERVILKHHADAASFRFDVWRPSATTRSADAGWCCC